MQLEHNQKETSVRFDFHSDVQQCTSIAFVVCKESEVDPLPGARLLLSASSRVALFQIYSVRLVLKICDEHLGCLILSRLGSLCSICV